MGGGAGRLGTAKCYVLPISVSLGINLRRPLTQCCSKHMKNITFKIYDAFTLQRSQVEILVHSQNGKAPAIISHTQQTHTCPVSRSRAPIDRRDRW